MTRRQIDTGTEELLAEQAEGVLTLVMNRPDARNALTTGMMEALADQLLRAESDDTVRCIVLTGAGKGFCSGGDVKGFAQNTGVEKISTDAAIRQQRRLQHGTVGRLYRMPRPTLAAVNGAAAGAGLALALACDLRIMSEDAIMTTSFARVGLSGDLGGSYLLSHLVGPAKAKELYLTSAKLSAPDALQLGLANWMASGNYFAALVAQTATDLAAGPSIAFGYMKENLNRAFDATLEECMDIEAVHHIHCIQTDDHKGAAEAFVRREQPVFHGR